MSGIVKFLAFVAVIYCITVWATENPKAASDFIGKVDGAYETTSDFVKDKIFDEKGE